MTNQQDSPKSRTNQRYLQIYSITLG